MDPRIVAALALSAIAFGFGGRFYWSKRTGYLHDTWYHLLASEKIRDNDHRLPDQIDHFIFEGPYDYPPGLHWVLSFFPEETVKRYNWLVAPVVELFHGLVLLPAIAYFLSGDPSVALIAAAIYAITPELLRHFTSLTPRVIGSFLFSLVFLSTLLAVGGRPLFYVPAVLLGGILLLTHKMSTQALAFTLVAFAVAELDPRYVGVLAAIIAFALVLSQGHYVAVLRSHLAIIDFWRVQRAKGNPPNSFMRDYGKQPNEGDQSLLGRVESIVSNTDPLMFGISNTWVLFLPIPLFALGGFDVLAGLERQIATWGLTILTIAIATQYVPPLKLVGEGHKYFMWGTFPGALVLATVAVNLDSVLVYGPMAVFYLVSVGFIYFMMRGRIQRANTASVDEATEDIIPRLRKPDVERIMCVPTGGSYNLAYLTRKKILWHDSTTAFTDGEVYYPTPLEPLEDIARDFDIDAIVIDTTQVRVDEADFPTYELRAKESAYLLLEPAA